MLTRIECRLLGLIAAGYTNARIRRIMVWAEGSPRRPNHTVDNRLNIIYRKMGIGTGVNKRVMATLMYYDLECPFASWLESWDGHSGGCTPEDRGCTPSKARP